MNLLVLDDEPKQMELTLAALKKTKRAADAHILTAASMDDVREIVENGTMVDIAILDIELGEGAATGIDTAKELFGAESMTQVIFLTGYVEYCTAVYETDHVYFLLKTASPDDLDAALRRAMDKIDTASRPIAIKSGRTVVSVASKQIVYMESKLRKVFFHIAGGEVLESYTKIDEMQDKVPTDHFVRTHKSFLVNMDYIERIESSKVTLRDGTEIPVSESRTISVRDAYFAFLRSLV